MIGHHYQFASNRTVVKKKIKTWHGVSFCFRPFTILDERHKHTLYNLICLEQYNSWVTAHLSCCQNLPLIYTPSYFLLYFILVVLNSNQAVLWAMFSWPLHHGGSPFVSPARLLYLVASSSLPLALRGLQHQKSKPHLCVFFQLQAAGIFIYQSQLRVSQFLMCEPSHLWESSFGEAQISTIMETACIHLSLKTCKAGIYSIEIYEEELPHRYKALDSIFSPANKQTHK